MRLKRSMFWYSDYNDDDDDDDYDNDNVND